MVINIVGIYWCHLHSIRGSQMGAKLSICMIIGAALINVSCTSSVGSKNVDFISGQSQATGGKNTIVICRPSAINQAFDSAGLTINNSPVTEIGSGQLYSVDIVKTNRLELQFTLPVTDLIANMWKPPTTFNLRLNANVPTHFIVLSVGTETDAMPSFSNNPRDMAFQSTSTWIGKEVDAKTLMARCGTFTPRFLVVKTLPQITDKGVLPGR